MFPVTLNFERKIRNFRFLISYNEHQVHINILKSKFLKIFEELEKNSENPECRKNIQHKFYINSFFLSDELAHLFSK